MDERFYRAVPSPGNQAGPGGELVVVGEGDWAAWSDRHVLGAAELRQLHSRDPLVCKCL